MSPTATDAFDLVVIGSGPAGEKGAAQAAYFGKRVALIEREAPSWGGACTNTGTLPSKTLRESALALSGMHSRGLEAAVLALPRPYTAATLMHRERLVVEAERARIARNMERHKVEMVAGTARFLDAKTVLVERPGHPDRRLRAEVFLVATGSRPYRPDWIPFAEPEVYDSDEILSMEMVPESIVALGSGVIASEYACLFAALGTTVTVLDGKEKLLAFLDGELCDRFHAELKRLGLRLSLGDAPSGCAVDPRTRQCTVTTKGGQRFEAQAVLAAAGRTGNSTALGLEGLGVQLDKRGNIQVDAHYQTAVPGIYAAGDVIGFPGLASTSMEQGRVAMCRAFGFAYKQHVASVIPYGIYTIPELSSVGATEEELQAAGRPYFAGRAFTRDNARGAILGAEGGFLKLLFAPDKTLLGVHMLGPQSTELIHIGAMALLQHASIDLFIEAVFNFPTLAELYKYAAYDGLGNLAGRHL